MKKNGGMTFKRLALFLGTNESFSAKKSSFWYLKDKKIYTIIIFENAFLSLDSPLSPANTRLNPRPASKIYIIDRYVVFLV